MGAVKLNSIKTCTNQKYYCLRISLTFSFLLQYDYKNFEGLDSDPELGLRLCALTNKGPDDECGEERGGLGHSSFQCPMSGQFAPDVLFPVQQFLLHALDTAQETSKGVGLKCSHYFLLSCHATCQVAYWQKNCMRLEGHDGRRRCGNSYRPGCHGRSNIEVNRANFDPVNNSDGNSLSLSFIEV